MAYLFQTFSSGDVHLASQANQTEVSIRDHVHGVDGVSDNIFSSAIFKSTVVHSVVDDGGFITVASFTVAAGALGARGIIEYEADLSYVGISAGGAEFTYNLTYGSTVVVSLTSNLTILSTIKANRILARLWASNSLTNIQGGLISQHLTGESAVASLVYITGGRYMFPGSGGEDSTLALPFKFSIRLGSLSGTQNADVLAQRAQLF